MDKGEQGAEFCNPS